VLFDGDCDFCHYWVDRWKARSGGRIDFIPYQEARDRFPFLEERDLAEAVHLVEIDGSVLFGAAAVFRIREVGMNRGGLKLFYRNNRWAAAFFEWAYRRVARNRPFFSCLTGLIHGRNKG
jgi:predicted DCC family thiol-disulfide oxidoreductase YuxK